MVEKLIVVIMGPGKEHFAKMCLESVKDADEIFYWTSADDLIDENQTIEFSDVEHISYYNEWDESDKQTNGKCRNRYLKHLKENYPNDWCLVIDEDEVCEDLNKIKEFIKTAEAGLYSPKMRHFIGDLGHEDATQKNHWVPNRLFKISEAKEYPLDSHTVLSGKQIGATDCTTIWHLGHLPVEYMKYISKRYKEHTFNSTIHTPKFLTSWRDAHLFGNYPKSPVNPTEIPKVILNNFNIDFDELYFKGRGLEVQNFIDAAHWKEFFKCQNAIELGCGLGPRVYAMNTIGIAACGIELSEYAVKHKMASKIIQKDVLDEPDCGNYDLAVAYDLLEHINYKDLSKALENLVHYSKKYILVSIPFIGDPSLEADPTHIIKETREWWLKQFISRGLKEIEVPEYFLFKKQLLIFEK